MAMEIFTVGRGQEGYPERLMPFADMPSRPVSYTHLTLPTICSV